MWCVTILILIDGFLQYRQEKINKEDKISHNPYFNRWFSAMSDIRRCFNMAQTSQSLF